MSVENLITEHLDIWTSAIKTKSSAGRGSSEKLELVGVKKLRELILELAMWGKLVPQDPNDEPASELLKRIAHEKAELVKEGKIKKQKPFLPIEEDDQPFKLPNGWRWSRFGELAQHNAGKTLDKGRNKGALRDYITTSNLYWGKFELTQLKQMPFLDADIEKCKATKFDLLICEGGEAGRAAVWEHDYDICFQNHVHRARFLSGMSPYFVFRLLQKMDFTGEINNYRKGVAISNMSGKALSSIRVPVPPHEEQYRIVAKVDELMALCDQLEAQTENSIQAHQLLVETLLATLSNAKDADELNDNWQRISQHFGVLFTTQDSIDQLKQTILQLAVMGKLVKQDPNDEPASKLLERIDAEKEQMIKDCKIKKQKPLPAIADNEKLFELPANWVFVRLQDAIDVRDGTHDSPRDAIGNNTYPLVTSKDFKGGDIDFDSARRISEADHYEISKRSLVEPDDILFSMIGGNIGNQVIVKDRRPFSIKNVALFKYYSKEATAPTFLKLYTEVLAQNLQNQASGGAQPFISLGKLRNLTFALPPINEQFRIVAIVNNLLNLCESLREKLNKASMTQLIIAKAVVSQELGSSRK